MRDVINVEPVKMPQFGLKDDHQVAVFFDEGEEVACVIAKQLKPENEVVWISDDWVDLEEWFLVILKEA